MRKVQDMLYADDGAGGPIGRENVSFRNGVLSRRGLWYD